MRHASFAVATLLAVAPFTAPASAFVTVVGNSYATNCFEHARAERSSSQALDECTQALEESLNRHNRAGTLVNRGIIYMNRRAYDLALADFDDAIALEPDLAEGHINRGGALIARDDYAGALAALERGLALNPADPSRAYYNRGIAHEELGQVREAYRDYRRAAELAPRWEPPRTELARFRVG
jgi:tetratricopeptide (TPR) repeat protein